MDIFHSCIYDINSISITHKKEKRQYTLQVHSLKKEYEVPDFMQTSIF